MSTSIHRLSALAFLVAAVPAMQAATPVIGAQLFQETNTRIEEMFGHRNSPPPPPGPRDNPFLLIEDEIPPGPKNPNDKSDNAPLVVNPNETPDEAKLRQAYSRLNFGGLIQVGDRPMVVINKATYKEGGLLTVRIQGEDVYLRIISLSKDNITLGLNDARLTLRF
jgi:hypothetical protein